MKREVSSTVIHTIKGIKGAPGLAHGKPVVVFSEEDLDKVTQGDLLIARETDIAYVPAMYKAGAIVTESGGRFSHAAVFARENSKPTVLNAEDATKWLMDVLRATVDADHGIVMWGTSA